jgi:hypothetical protein
MKSINLPPLFFLTNPLRAVSNNFSESNKQKQSPYLKAILSGKVAKGREIYCSDQTITQVKKRWDDTLLGMESKICVSDQGDELDMLDILKSSLANPENRRAELMVRMSGFEQYADSQEHQIQRRNAQGSPKLSSVGVVKNPCRA